MYSFITQIKNAAVFLSVLLALGSTQSVYSQIDPLATEQTKALYHYLKENTGKQLFYGHHVTTYSGVDFTDPTQCLGKSDVYAAVKDYPALFSYDFSHGFSKQIAAVQWAYSKGAIITFSFHSKNPVTKHGVFSDSTRVLEQILPGKPQHHLLLQLLDSVADFAHQATYNNEPIPIIFRPWHEHTGGWFWWGTGDATADEFIELWRFTVTYLRDVKKVRNFLYAYSPSKPAERVGGYEFRNPGAEYFDIAGFDCYAEESFKKEFINNCKVTVKYAVAHNKIAANTEFGYRRGLKNSKKSKWYLSEFFSPLKKDKYASQIVYAVTWGNTQNTYWVPTKKTKQYKSFVDFYNDPYSAFLGETHYRNNKTE